VGCVGPPEVSFNYAGSASQGGAATSALLADTAATATNALNLGSVAATNYARRDVNNSFTGDQAVAGKVSVSSTAASATVLYAQAADLSSQNTAVWGQADGEDGTGVFGYANNGSIPIGVWGWSSTGLAGEFDGDVNIIGNLSKSGGSFKIDHPLDPANKYLSHSFVESPDMKNVYDGVVTLDAQGEAVVELPEWFQALNRDFRYQLTAIGAPAPNLYVAAEVQGNRFKIAGGIPQMKVSWQVTGVRQDAWANAHRIPVEVEKSARERGHYLHPELHGAAQERSIQWAHHPSHMRQMKERHLKLDASAPQ
jgi:hypothetical protein